MRNYNYYLDQLDQIKNHDEYASLIKVRGCSDIETNWLSLNEESAKVLIEWLTKNYLKD